VAVQPHATLRRDGLHPSSHGRALAGFADLLCVNDPPPVNSKRRSAVSVRGGRQLVGEQACYRLAVPGRLSARWRCRSTALLFPPCALPGNAPDRHRGNMDTIEQCPKGSVRCWRRQGWQGAVLMAWTCASQLQRGSHTHPNFIGFNNLTVTRKFLMWPGIDGGLPIKVGNRQCHRNCRRCRRQKTKGRRLCRHPRRAPGTAVTFRGRRAREFLPDAQKIDVCYR
jgi:hypothetical protein